MVKIMVRWLMVGWICWGVGVGGYGSVEGWKDGRMEGKKPEALKPEPQTPNPKPRNSLWSGESGSLYSDFKARKMGDVLTILVTENAVASARADTKTAKAESGSMEAGVGPLLKIIFPELSAEGKTSLSSTGSTTRSGSLVARLSVVVTEVLPGGTLRVEGTRRVQINGETQKLVISGLVRVRDISAENTISSSLVANAEIKFEGKGIVGSRQREGLITRIFKLLF